MSTWRRIFGLDAFDVILQTVITGVLVFVITATNSERDALIGDSVITLTSLIVLGIRRKLALRGGRVPGLSSGEMAAERLAQLEQRMEDLEAAQGRVAELEERLDFAERLLARKEPAKELLP
jgi:hypothetical protein